MESSCEARKKGDGLGEQPETLPCPTSAQWHLRQPGLTACSGSNTRLGLGFLKVFGLGVGVVWDLGKCCFHLREIKWKVAEH